MFYKQHTDYPGATYEVLRVNRNREDLQIHDKV